MELHDSVELHAGLAHLPGTRRQRLAATAAAAVVVAAAAAAATAAAAAAAVWGTAPVETAGSGVGTRARDARLMSSGPALRERGGTLP